MHNTNTEVNLFIGGLNSKPIANGKSKKKKSFHMSGSGSITFLNCLVMKVPEKNSGKCSSWRLQMMMKRPKERTEAILYFFMSTQKICMKMFLSYWCNK